MKLNTLGCSFCVNTVSSNCKPHGELGGFTLVELLGVMTIIVMLAGLTYGSAGYIEKRMVASAVHAQITMIESALEIYKSDWGYYPSTLPARISANGISESLNNSILYNALCPTNPSAGRKIYLSFSAAQIRTNTGTQLPNIYDGWGRPLNYYNSPGTVFAIVTSAAANFGYTVGGQVNVNSFDLFSYGADGYTYAVTNTTTPSGWPANWLNPSAANDDVANWGQ